MRRTMALVAAVTGLAFAAPAALGATAPKDYSQTALNIIPSGQADPGETLLPGVLPNDTQAQMYNALTPLFNHVTNGDLTAFHKNVARIMGEESPTTSALVVR